MDSFARLIDSWLWFVYFPAHPKKQEKIQPLIGSTRFCHERKQEKSQDRLGKDVFNSLEIRIKLKFAPTSTLRIGRIN